MMMKPLFFFMKDCVLSTLFDSILECCDVKGHKVSNTQIGPVAKFNGFHIKNSICVWKRDETLCCTLCRRYECLWIEMRGQEYRHFLFLFSSLDDLFAYCICSVVLSDSLLMQFVAQVDSVHTNSDGSIFQTEFSIRNFSFYISQVLKALSKNWNRKVRRWEASALEAVEDRIVASVILTFITRRRLLVQLRRVADIVPPLLK
jgi:hypothetical protein